MNLLITYYYCDTFWGRTNTLISVDKLTIWPTDHTDGELLWNKDLKFSRKVKLVLGNAQIILWHDYCSLLQACFFFVSDSWRSLLNLIVLAMTPVFLTMFTSIQYIHTVLTLKGLLLLQLWLETVVSWQNSTTVDSISLNWVCEWWTTCNYISYISSES